MTETPKWKDGTYRMSSLNHVLFKVVGESCKAEPLSGTMDDSFSLGTWKYGDFGEAHPDVAKAAGKTTYNVDMNLWGGMWKCKGIVSEDGSKITVFSITNEVGHFELMSEEEYLAFMNNADPADAPPSHYKLQPEFQGKLIWVTGAPGLGKSTSGLYLSKMAGYVYYEADAWGMNVNPYIPPDVEEPSLATCKQKPLRGVPQERLDAIDKGIKDFMAMIEGKDFEQKSLENFYASMCKDILTEKKRMGGDWVVAQAVPSRALRDHIRSQLGPELIFVVLSMPKEDQKARLIQRHGEESGFLEHLEKMDIWEPAEADEERTIDLQLTKDMDRKEVARKILDMIPQ